MGNDLPDYQSQVVGAGLEATSFRSGLDADKPASPAAGDIWLARDTYKLYCCMVAGAWKDLGYWRADVSQAQPSRTWTTVYQNTSGKIRLVTITLDGAAAALWAGEAYLGAANPPTDRVAVILYSSQTAYASMTFIVPPNYYYKLEQTGAAAIYKWYEWDLF